MKKTPQAGLEPATLRLTVECSAIELLRIIFRYQLTFLVIQLFTPSFHTETYGVLTHYKIKIFYCKVFFIFYSCPFRKVLPIPQIQSAWLTVRRMFRYLLFRRLSCTLFCRMPVIPITCVRLI